MINITDLINGAEGYKNFSNFIIINNTSLFDYNILKQDAIIFCKTDYVFFLFNNIKFSNKKYVLITHHSDYHIHEMMFKSRPNCIKKWYAWTAKYEHEDLIGLPIGFAVFYDVFPKVNKTLEKWFFDNVERLRLIEKDPTTIYCNFTIDKLRPSRHQVIPKITANGVKCFIPENKHTPYGKLSYTEYCEDMARFKFVASPLGDGGDSNRTWDALYMGCIPIVQNDLIYKKLDLPFLIVNDYSEVTNDLLNNYLNYYNDHKFKWEQATLSYWEKRMKEDLK